MHSSEADVFYDGFLNRQQARLSGHEKLPFPPLTLPGIFHAVESADAQDMGTIQNCTKSTHKGLVPIYHHLFQ